MHYAPSLWKASTCEIIRYCRKTILFTVRQIEEQHYDMMVESSSTSNTGTSAFLKPLMLLLYRLQGYVVVLLSQRLMGRPLKKIVHIVNI